MPRILIADDNSNIQKMVTLALHDAGIEVVSVSNGGAAIRSLPDTLPDLVLADVFMPVRNGYEVCEFIKHDTRFSQVPVVLLVGAFDPLDETEAQRVSADGILKKPFIPPDPLINLVKALLSKSFHERPEPVPVRVAVHAGHEAGPDEAGHPAGHAGEAPAAAAAVSEPLAEASVPDVTEANFGSHEETLAFGSLLQMPAPAETTAEPSAAKPAAWDMGGAVAEIPALDDVVPPDSMNKTLHAPVTDDSNGVFDGSAADLEAELGFQMPPELGEEIEAALEPDSEESEAHTEFHPDVSSAASFDPVGDTEIETSAEPAATEPKPWENAAPPVDVEPPAMVENAEVVREDVHEDVHEEKMAGNDLADASQPGYGELADTALIESDPTASRRPISETLHDASEASSSNGAPLNAASSSAASPDWPPASWAQSPTEAPPAWVTPAVPVFPGSDKLWAAPPAPSEAEQAPVEEDKKEIAAHATEATHETETVPAAASDHGGDYGVDEIELPALDVLSLAEHSLNRSGIAEHVAELLPPEPLAEMVAAPVTSDAELEQHSAAGAATRPELDPAMIEAVVTRIVERMQPKVMDVVTREILRPLVEALVRREINRNS